MKVSEAIDRLKVGDTVWVKGKVLDFDRGGYDHCPLEVSLFYEDEWIHENDEITLTEPQAEKVEVELTRSQADFMKEHENDSLYKLMRASIPEYEELFARARLNGYTVKPKRWVVKLPETGKYFANISYGKMFGMIAEISEREAKDAYPFTDRAKAEAVATLVEGTVEEV